MEHAIGNIYVRPMTGAGVDPGWSMHGHTHNFDHTSIFFTGRWRVRRWRPAVNAAGEQLTMPGGETAWIQLEDFERDAPFYLLIEAGCRHKFDYVGPVLPSWMEAFLADLTPERADEFRAQHALTQGKAWCVYSHRNAQGDVVEHTTGWSGAYS